MKFILKLIMGEAGDFPGAPDTESVEISSNDYDYLFDRFCKGRVH